MNRQQRRASAKQAVRSVGPLGRSITAIREQGAEHHRAGRFAQAEVCYREVLKSNPDDPDILHLLGLVCYQTRRFDLAVDFIGAAIARSDKSAVFHASLGGARLQLGQFELALASLDRALAIDPVCEDALKYRFHALWELKRSDEAFAVYQTALQIKPDDVVLLEAYAVALQEHGESRRALEIFDRLLGLAPGKASVLHGRGNAFFVGKQYDAALYCFEAALAIEPGLVSAEHNRGAALLELRQLEKAEEVFRRAIKDSPRSVILLNNYGNVLLGMGKLEAAAASYQRALEVQPDHLQALNNLGNVQRDLGLFDEALSNFRKAIAIRPDFADAHWNEGLIHLLRGDLGPGWVKSEWRWKCNRLDIVRREFKQPQWMGEEIAGKTVLLHNEQGLGDAIQFSRYAPMVAALGGRVILQVPKVLIALLSTLGDDIQYVADGAPLPEFDLQSSLTSLPMAFRTELATVPAATSYLKPAADAHARDFGLDPERLKVGLVWSGNPRHANDHNRSMALAQLEPLFDLPVQFVSLMNEVRPSDRQVLEKEARVMDLAPSLKTFSDTAALVSQLDLVISVDTSVAHLAGALGTPVWILLPLVPDWRWMLGREDTPWYPTARLFRQSAPRDWAGVVTRLRAALQDFAAPAR